MKTFRTAPALLAWACAAACGMAQAQVAGSGLRLSGFGTLGVVHFDEDQAEFVTPGQPGGGASGDTSFNPDTRLGVQADYAFNPALSATVQAILKGNGAGNRDVGFAWAFVKYRITPQLSTRLGRVVAPTYMISDFRDVNYANIWVRPPLEVYGQVSATNVDGIDLSYQFNIGGAALSASAYYGSSAADYNSAEVKLFGRAGINLTAELDGGWSFRLGYSYARVKIESPTLTPLVGGLRAASASPTVAGLGLSDEFLATAEAIDYAGKPASFVGAGVTWDQGNWIVQAEYTQREIEGYLADSTGYYASVGYRVGKLTPFVYYARLKVDSESLANPIPTALLVSPTLRSLSDGVNYVTYGANYGQKTVAVGLRWDVLPSLALKFQLERIKPDGAAGLLYVPSSQAANLPSFDGETLNAYSLSLDFVF